MVRLTGFFLLFPAHAGVILLRRRKILARQAIPRTRGGDPTVRQSEDLEDYYSPHTRG